MISFDTNILVYAADRGGGERHSAAVDLIERSIRRGNCIQTLQSFCEFFSVVTRKSGIETGTATAFVDGWRSVMLVEAATPGDLGEAMRAVTVYRIGFWDAMLWATARRAGVRVLFSEDFQDGRTMEGVRILNPFYGHNAAEIEQSLRQ
ncbi:MAG: PIN domain-containing protein [Alphaproteobacteria bacterium]|nr:PIN domain-containing protein [Alphaproteobacteria bacterium]MBV9816504.1 PIN domain-containing protein [Alphaproteobacteria bacterium]